MPSKLVDFAATAIILALTIYLLFIGRNFLLPFVTAIVIWYIIISFARFFSTLPFSQVELPHSLSLLIAIVISGCVFYFIFILIGTSIFNITNDASLYQAKLASVVGFLNEKAQLNLNATDLLVHISLPELFTNIALALTSIMQNLILIMIYVLLLLLEGHSFRPKLRAMFKDEKQYNKTLGLVKKIQQDINHYLRIKSFVSFLTGAISYIVLLSFGIREAEFWAILIFLLNYIPTIGSIVAVILTLLVVSVQFDALAPFITLSIMLIAIQFIMGNLVEPKLTGTTLNLSPVVILLSLAIWGSLWGVIGMFLCVPLITILNIVLAQFDSTRPIAVLLTADGQLPEKA